MIDTDRIGHTPGIWRIRGLSCYEIRTDDRHIADVYTIGAGPCEEEANARLIAAAPDLLAVCKAIHETGIPTPEAFDALTAAIAKAENG